MRFKIKKIINEKHLNTIIYIYLKNNKLLNNNTKKVMGILLKVNYL